MPASIRGKPLIQAPKYAIPAMPHGAGRGSFSHLHVPYNPGDFHTTRMALTADTRLGPYQIAALIGAGGMGRSTRPATPS